LKERIAIALATCFGIGELPKAPGTWASLVALPFAWLIQSTFGMAGLLAAAIVVFMIGWWASSVYITWSGAEDPAPVVIDEVAGQWLTLVLADPRRWWLWLIGFAVFRLFDIVKPWPVSWADRNVRGGLGCMLDDVLAGLYGFVVLAAILLLERSDYFR
jgi:phosphatidylglycerophosphatase A